MLVGRGIAAGAATSAYNAVANWAQASKYLHRLPASNGSQQRFTASAWLRQSSTGAQRHVMASEGSGAGTIFWIRFTAGNALEVVISGAGTALVTTATYASTSKWYHVVVAVDTTQATAADRIKVYVDGVQVKSFSSANYYALNDLVKANTTADRIYLGAVNAAGPFTGKLAHCTWVDGAQLAPTDFAQAGQGGKVPKRYPGAFGTNGWCVDFADTGTIGNDVSGNNNDLTVAGLVAGDVSAEQVYY